MTTAPSPEIWIDRTEGGIRERLKHKYPRNRQGRRALERAVQKELERNRRD